MQKICNASTLEGIIIAPASKSMTIRAYAAALLASGTSTIIRPSLCTDALDAQNIIRKLGAEVLTGGGETTVMGGFLPRSRQLKCGESGLAMRLFAPIAALHPNEFTFLGEGSLLSRPVNMIGEALSQLGGEFQATNGLLPFTVKGPIKGGKVVIDGSVSSQLLSGLLMALPLAKEDSEIIVSNLQSRPYVDMTLQLMEDFGIHAENKDYGHFLIKGNQQYAAREYTIEGDWSAAAFLLVAGAISGNVNVQGILQTSKQADKAILEVLKMAGANLKVHPEAVEVNKSDLRAFTFDAGDCPDLFPPLAALAANCIGISVITGIDRLIHKESNRAQSIFQILTAMGIRAVFQDNSLHIEGGKIKGTLIDSHNDHRIAMMAATLALTAEGMVAIDGAECVAKSYPTFFEDMKRVGMKIQ